MATFTWRNGNVPDNLKITQVYGIIFSFDGRILLSAERTGEKVKYSLIGGHPESFDNGMEETLRREVLEEVNITVAKPLLLGYQEVDEENGSPLYAQVRMVALIDGIGEIRPDVDNGKTYDRLLVPPSRAIQLLQWGKVGEEQITAALKIAENVFDIHQFSEKEEFI